MTVLEGGLLFRLRCDRCASAGLLCSEPQTAAHSSNVDGSDNLESSSYPSKSSQTFPSSVQLLVYTLLKFCLVNSHTLQTLMECNYGLHPLEV
jgi:hypothetical protein